MNACSYKNLLLKNGNYSKFSFSLLRDSEMLERAWIYQV